MATTPPVILVFDINALSTATPREWLEFSRVGDCIVPQIVYDEMKFLFDRSPDPDLERIAKAFSRFYPTSGWQISEVSSHHVVLKTATGGQSLTKRSRVSLAVGRCAYGIATHAPANLVVLVSNDRTMLQRIFDIQVANLCGITVQSLLQWCRTGQRPVAVSQKIQELKVGLGVTTHSAIAKSKPQPSPSSKLSASPSKVTYPTALSTASRRPSQIRREGPSNVLPQLFSLLLAAAALAFAGWLIWSIIQYTRGGLNNLNDSSTPAYEAPAAQFGQFGN